MNQASLYAKVNCQARHDAKQVIKENAKLIQWRKDGRDAFIDIGSGPGTVVKDFLYPLLPANYKELVVSDISDKMLNYASEFFSKDERVKFQVLDISTEVLPQELRGRFDHVTSFYCLHWVQNQRKMVDNINELLSSDGGDCLLLFLAASVSFESYEIISKNSKWSGYMHDYEQFTSPYYHSLDAASEFRKLLEQAGFEDCKVELRNQEFVYEGVNSVRDTHRSICPFYESIPKELHEEFFNEYLKIVKSKNIPESIEGTDDFKFRKPYKIVIAYARKPKGCHEKKVK